MDVVGWNDSPGMRPNVGATGVEQCAVKWHVRCDQRIIPSLPIAGSGRSPRSKEMQSFSCLDAGGHRRVGFFRMKTDEVAGRLMKNEELRMMYGEGRQSGAAITREPKYFTQSMTPP